MEPEVSVPCSQKLVLFPLLFHSTLSTLNPLKTPELFVTSVGVVLLFILLFLLLFLLLLFFSSYAPSYYSTSPLSSVCLSHGGTLKVSTFFVVLLCSYCGPRRTRPNGMLCSSHVIFVTCLTSKQHFFNFLSSATSVLFKFVMLYQAYVLNLFYQ